MKNLNKKTKLILFSILYWIVFVIAPFLLLKFTIIIQDFSWYLMYFVLMFPFTFIAFLLVYRKKFKKSISHYKKILLLFWFIFIFIYLFLVIYIYNKVVEAFENSSFPF